MLSTSLIHASFDKEAKYFALIKFLRSKKMFKNRNK